MSFKTMDGVEVYDKAEVDGIVESVNATSAQQTSDITNLKTKTNSLENSKANTAQVQTLANELAAAEQRLTGAESNISEHNSRITALENNAVSVTAFNQAMNNKADKTYAQQTRQIANSNQSDITELAGRVTSVENSKVNTSDLPQAVNSVVDSIINDKLSLIESDINHIVDNAVDDGLENYDNSNTVDQKIATAVATRPVAMTASEATALINQYF